LHLGIRTKLSGQGRALSGGNYPFLAQKGYWDRQPNRVLMK